MDFKRIKARDLFPAQKSSRESDEKSKESMYIGLMKFRTPCRTI